MSDLNIRDDLTVVYFTRQGVSAPFFALREFDTKILRMPVGHREKGSLRVQGVSEQAIRARITQVIMKLHLAPVKGLKSEVKVLKQRGILGKRAPKCSLLSGDDMVRLLRAFGREAYANDLVAAIKKLKKKTSRPTKRQLVAQSPSTQERLTPKPSRNGTRLRSECAAKRSLNFRRPNKRLKTSIKTEKVDEAKVDDSKLDDSKLDDSKLDEPSPQVNSHNSLPRRSPLFPVSVQRSVKVESDLKRPQLRGGELDAGQCKIGFRSVKAKFDGRNSDMVREVLCKPSQPYLPPASELVWSPRSAHQVTGHLGLELDSSPLLSNQIIRRSRPPEGTKHQRACSSFHSPLCQNPPEPQLSEPQPKHLRQPFSGCRYEDGFGLDTPESPLELPLNRQTLMKPVSLQFPQENFVSQISPLSMPLRRCAPISCAGIWSTTQSLEHFDPEPDFGKTTQPGEQRLDSDLPTVISRPLSMSPPPVLYSNFDLGSRDTLSYACLVPEHKGSSAPSFREVSDQNHRFDFDQNEVSVEDQLRLETHSPVSEAKYLEILDESKSKKKSSEDEDQESSGPETDAYLAICRSLQPIIQIT